jgi:hypothetical protein
MTVNITCDLIQLHFEAFGAHCGEKGSKTFLYGLISWMTIEVTTNSLGVNFLSFLSSSSLDKVKQSN